MPLTKVTRGALTADIIDSTKLADNAVDTEHLADDAVESAEIGENITFTGDYIGLPVFANNTARDAAIASPAAGMMCFNTAQAAVQQYTGATDGWSDIAPAPTFSGFASGYAVINEDDDVTIKIDGGQFAPGMTVDMVNNANDTNVTNYGGLSYTLVSSTQISISIGAATNNITSGTVVYFNITKGGIAVKTSTITVGADPVWGSLANPFANTYDGAAVSDVLGTLPAATVSTGGDITYSLVSETSTSSNDYAINSSTRVVTVADQAIDWTSGTETDVLVARATGADASQVTDLGSINIIVHQYKATGGARTTYGSYVVHSFTSVGNTTFTVYATTTCDILMVAGGGGGGSSSNVPAGGGAGGMLVGTKSIAAGTYTIVVGDGGAVGSNGQNTTAFSATANGGGRGGHGDSSSSTTERQGGTGGSGGGGTYEGRAYGSGNQGDSGSLTGYGGNGGTGGPSGNGHPGGGGGGAGGAGVTPANNTTPGTGGAGRENAYRTGSNITYAGGGGGGVWISTAQALGGSGGGGNGATHSTAVASAGTDGLGGGGGGGSSGSYPSQSGGSGIVVVRFAI